MATQGERIAILESRVNAMEANLTARLERMDAKLEALLSLKDKGAGAFWLASMLFGTSIVGGLVVFMNWLKGAV